MALFGFVYISSVGKFRLNLRIKLRMYEKCSTMYTLVNVYVDLLVFTPEVVDIVVKSYIEKHAICLKDYRIKSFLSIWHAHGDLCKHLGIDSSTGTRIYS